MPPNNPYAAPQTVHLALAAAPPAPVLDEALLPVIQGAALCYRALMSLVGTIIGSVILWLIFMGGTDNYFLSLLGTGVLISAAMHLWGLAKMKAAPRASNAGLLLTVSFGLGLLFFAIQIYLSTRAILSMVDLDIASPFLSTIVWGAKQCSLGSCVFLLFGIQRLGSYTKSREILLPCRLAMLCLFLSFSVGLAYEAFVTYPDLAQRMELSGYFERISFVSGGAVALALLSVIMGLAFYATALHRLMNLNYVLQAMQSEIPPHLDHAEE